MNTDSHPWACRFTDSKPILNKKKNPRIDLGFFYALFEILPIVMLIKKTAMFAATIVEPTGVP